MLMRTREGRADARILAKACGARMLARSTNANGAPTSGYCADSCARVKGAPTSGFCEGVCMMRMLARSTNANGSPMNEFREGVSMAGRLRANANGSPMIGFLQRRVYGGMLARSTNANDAPTCGYCADSCARVKGAPMRGFCESVWGADACAEYECERPADARMLRWLMRTREGRADERFLRRRVRRGCLRGVRMRTAHRCADAPLAHANA